MAKRPKKLTDKELLAKIKKAAEEGRIEMAPTEKLDKLYDIAYDFVEHCLGHRECFISDLSTVHDFDVEYEEVIDKAKIRYGIDITPVVKKYIVVIAQFLLDEQP